MGAAKTYDLVVTNLTTNESVTIYGSRRGVVHWSPPMKGFGDPDVRTSSYIYSGSDGGHISEQFYGMRQIPLSIFLYSDSYQTFEDTAALLARVFKIRDKLRVQLITPLGKVFQVTAKLTQPFDPKMEYPLLADYDIELVAEDPVIYDYTNGAALQVTLQRPSLGGLLWDSTGLLWNSNGLPWVASGSGVIINNDGNADVWPFVTVTGVSQNMSVTNQTTNQTVSLNITTTATDVVKIDMYNREVTLNEVNIFNNLTSADFWRLTPGMNSVVFNSTGTGDTATALLKWNNGFTGVL